MNNEEAIKHSICYMLSSTRNVFFEAQLLLITQHNQFRNYITTVGLKTTNKYTKITHKKNLVTKKLGLVHKEL